MNKIKLGHIETETPVKWNDLTAKQLLYIAACWRGWVYVLKSKQKGLDKQKIAFILRQRILLQQVLMNINPLNVFSKRTRTFNRLAPEQMHELIKTHDFIFAENTLTVNLLPVIKGLYGPQAELNGISIGEFASAETNYLRYHNTGNDIHLDKLCAILYRAKSDRNYGDLREKFHPDSVEWRMQQVSKWDTHYKQAVLLFYIGSRSAIIKRFKQIFSGDKKGSNTNWADIIIGIAGNKFGTVDQTFEQSLTTVLTYLRQLQQNQK